MNIVFISSNRNLRVFVYLSLALVSAAGSGFVAFRLTQIFFMAG